MSSADGLRWRSCDVEDNFVHEPGKGSMSKASFDMKALNDPNVHDVPRCFYSSPHSAGVGTPGWVLSVGVLRALIQVEVEVL